MVTSAHLYTSLISLAGTLDEEQSILLLCTLTALLPLTPAHSQQHILTLSDRIQVIQNVHLHTVCIHMDDGLQKACMCICVCIVYSSHLGELVC